MSQRWVPDLLDSVRRTTVLTPLLVSSTLGVTLLAALLTLGVRLAPMDVASTLRFSLAVTLVGATFLLDDPARTSTQALPVSPARVAAIRLAFGTAILTVSWIAQLLLAPQLSNSSLPFDPRPFVIEAYGIVVWLWVGAAWRAPHDRKGSGASFAAPALLLLFVALMLLPDSVALFVDGDSPDLVASRWRWAVVLLTGVISLALLLAPSRRRRRS